MNSIERLVAAAVLGILAGACGAAQPAAKSAQPPGPQPAPQAAVAGDKHACGNHEGAGCGAVEPAPK
jgi:hypothetical protein